VRIVLVLCLLACSAKPPRREVFPGERTIRTAPHYRFPRQLALGSYHSCLLERGHVWCWGKNDHGQLGNGTRASSSRPVEVPGLAQVIQISLGDDHSCALVAGGRVLCWGDGHSGQLELGTGTPKPSWNESPPPDATRPVAVAVAGVTEIAAGHDHTCALLANRQVVCWGNDSHGELGGAESSPQALVPGITDAVHIRAGGTTSCAVRATGTVTCWGGHWTTGLFDSGKRKQPPTDIPALAGVSSLAVGAYHACGLRAGAVVCYGKTNLLGDPAIPCCKPAASKLTLADVDALTLGFEHSCARRSISGTVECWGHDDRLNATAPTPIAGLTRQYYLAAGAAHTCALGQTGVSCWGADDYGQLGGGTMGRISTPTRVPDLDDATDLALGFIHSCALRRDGRVACWPGDNARVRDIPAFGKATAVSSGIYETCAVSGTKVRCLQRSLSADFPPGAITVPRPSDGFVVGGSGICVRTKSRQLACVHEVPDAHSLPGPLAARKLVPVAGFTDVTTFASGAGELCAATPKHVVCASADRLRRKGEPPWSKPVPIAGVTGAEVVALAGGGYHSCALLRSGKIACWGAGNMGELGDGNLVNTSAAVMVKTIDDATQITAGDEHTCALRKSGTVWCWGRDHHGQLGDGDTVFDRRAEPTEVKNLAGVLEVAAAAFHTCARTADAVYCWGSNELGRLGIGVRPRSDTPVPVPRQ
jgi:alpha-tubulin suppressor-like RCC1 family protein